MPQVIVPAPKGKERAGHAAAALRVRYRMDRSAEWRNFTAATSGSASQPKAHSRRLPVSIASSVVRLVCLIRASRLRSIFALTAAATLAACPVTTAATGQTQFGYMEGDSPLAVYAGDTISLRAFVRNADKSGVVGVDIHWTVADPTVASIEGPSVTTTAQPPVGFGDASAYLTLRAHKDGVTTVTAAVPGATDQNNQPLVRTFTATVASPTSIQVTPSPLIIEVGRAAIALDASVVSGTGAPLSGINLTWTCPSGQSIATLTMTGGSACPFTSNVSIHSGGVAVGNTTFHVAIDGALFNRFPVAVDLPVTVTQPVARVDIVPASVTVASPTTFSAILKDAQGNPLPAGLWGLGHKATDEIQWSTSDPTVATVASNSSVVTGVAPDQVTISARYCSIISATLPAVCSTGTLPITVGGSTNTATISPASLSVVSGGQRPVQVTYRNAAGTIIASNTTWLSRNTSLATVTDINSQNGFVQGVSTGVPTTTPSATVQILVRGAGTQGVANVTVYRPVSTVTVLPATLSLHPTETSTLQPAVLKDNLANVIPLDATTVTWSSDNPSVATVDQTGKVTAVSAGTGGQSTQIRATTAEGVSGVMTVTVTPVASNNVTWTFCPASGLPLWVAVQDGSGAWTQVTGTNNVFPFLIASTKGGIAYVTLANSVYKLNVFYGSQAELVSQGSGLCTNSGATKTIGAGVSNTGTAATMFASLGQAFKFVSLPTTLFQWTNVGPGTLDVVASTVDGAVPPNFIRMLTRRNVNATDGTIITALDMGASSTEAFVPSSAALTLANSLGQQVNLTGQLHTTNNFLSTYFIDGSSSAATARTLFGLTAGATVGGDLHYWSAVANGSGSGAVPLRTAGVVFGTVAPKTLTFGSALNTPTFSKPTGFIERAALAVQAEYNRFFQLDYDQVSSAGRSATVQMTAAYLNGATTANVDLPDLSSVTGWNAIYGLQTGTPAAWKLAAANWSTSGGVTFVQMLDAATYTSATAVGTVTP